MRSAAEQGGAVWSRRYRRAAWYEREQAALGVHRLGDELITGLTDLG
jgi:hypothetical protein